MCLARKFLLGIKLTNFDGLNLFKIVIKIKLTLPLGNVRIILIFIRIARMIL